MNIIVTGGTGFIGSNLVKKLVESNNKVFLIVRESSKFDKIEEVLDRIEIFKYDNELDNLTKFFDEVKPDLVYHLASLANSESNDIEDLINSNIRFPLQILEAMKITGYKKIINIGTYSQHFINENYNPMNLYSSTKQAFEDLLIYYVEVEGFLATTLKLFDNFGENDDRVKIINILIYDNASDKRIDVSKGEQKMNLIYIDDVIEALVLAGKSIVEGHKVYFVGSDELYSIREVADLIEKIKGCKLNINWGGRKYRKRELMEAKMIGEKLPNWEQKVSLEKGLRLVIESKNDIHNK